MPGVGGWDGAVPFKEGDCDFEGFVGLVVVHDAHSCLGFNFVRGGIGGADTRGAGVRKDGRDGMMVFLS